MSEVSITEVNLTEDLRTGKFDRRSGKDRRVNTEPYAKEERRKGERRQNVRRQKDVDSILD